MNPLLIALLAFAVLPKPKKKRVRGGSSRARMARVLRWLDMINKACAKYPDVPNWLVCGVMDVESGGDPNAASRNPNGTIAAQGLMQFIKKSWSQYGQGDRTDPWQSIQAGVHLLHDLYNKGRNKKKLSESEAWRYAIASYNRGSGAVDKTWPSLPPKGKIYYDWVMGRIPQYKKALGA